MKSRASTPFQGSFPSVRDFAILSDSQSCLKRALSAGDELHDAGELGQLPQDLAETPAETFSRGKAAPETLRRHERPVKEEIIINLVVSQP